MTRARSAAQTGFVLAKQKVHEMRLLPKPRPSSCATLRPRWTLLTCLVCILAAGCGGDRTGGNATGAGGAAPVELGEFARTQLANTNDNSEAVPINAVPITGVEREDENEFDDLFGR